MMRIEERREINHTQHNTLGILVISDLLGYAVENTSKL